MVVKFLVGLCGFFVVAKAFVRLWLVRSERRRPEFLKSPVTLELVNLLAWLAIIVVFFLLLNTPDEWIEAVAVLLGAIAYDWLARLVFLEWEVHRAQRSASTPTRRAALQRVCRRAGYREPASRQPSLEARHV